MKHIILILLALIPLLVKGQGVYIDALTPAAFTAYSGTIKSAQNKTNNSLTKIESAQIFAATQLKLANDLHDKMLKGLTEVSGTLTNGMTVKGIIEESKYTIEYLQEAIKLSTKQPALLIVSREAMKEFRRRTLLLSTQMTTILTGGDTNLMTAGERQKLLDAIYLEVKLLASSAYTIKNTMYWASKFGIWNELNPFKNYVNYDRMIMQDIIRKSKMF